MDDAKKQATRVVIGYLILEHDTIPLIHFCSMFFWLQHYGAFQGSITYGQ